MCNLIFLESFYFKISIVIFYYSININNNIINIFYYIFIQAFVCINYFYCIYFSF